MEPSICDFFYKRPCMFNTTADLSLPTKGQILSEIEFVSLNAKYRSEK